MDEAYLRPLVFLGDGGSAWARRATRCASPSPSTSGARTSAKRRCSAASAPRSRRSRAARSTRRCPRARSAASTSNSVLAKREAKHGAATTRPSCSTRRPRRRGSGENIFLVQQRRINTPPLSSRDPRGHHARHRDHAGARARAGGRGGALHARRALARRRGLLHRHRRRADAGPRDRRSPDRRGRVRPGHAQAAGRLLRGGQGPRRQEKPSHPEWLTFV